MDCASFDWKDVPGKLKVKAASFKEARANMPGDWKSDPAGAASTNSRRRSLDNSLRLHLSRAQLIERALCACMALSLQEEGAMKHTCLGSI